MTQINVSHQMLKTEKLASSRQVAKLRKEDDEEQWISGEELNTDGSSDEDGSVNRVKRKSDSRSKLKNASAGGIRYRGKLKRSPPLIAVAPAPVPSADFLLPSELVKSTEKSAIYKDGPSCSNSLEIIDDELEEISWRPKRGSIKLPNLNAEGSLADLLHKTQI